MRKRLSGIVNGQCIDANLIEIPQQVPRPLRSRVPMLCECILQNYSERLALASADVQHRKGVLVRYDKMITCRRRFCNRYPHSLDNRTVRRRICAAQIMAGTMLCAGRAMFRYTVCANMLQQIVDGICARVLATLKVGQP